MIVYPMNKQRTRWGYHEFTSFVPFREAVLFSEVQIVIATVRIFRSHDLSTVERFIIQCPFLGGSTIGGYTVFVIWSTFTLFVLLILFSYNSIIFMCFCI